MAPANHHSSVILVLPSWKWWQKSATIRIHPLATGLVNSGQFNLVRVILPTIDELVLLSLIEALYISVVLEIRAWRLGTIRTIVVVVVDRSSLSTSVVSRPRNILAHV